MAKFTGTTYDEAVAEAEKHLGVDRADLVIEVISQGNAGRFFKRSWRISAERAATASKSDDVVEDQHPEVSQLSFTKDEARPPEVVFNISLHFTPEGVMLDCPTDISDTELVSYIARRGISNPDLVSAKKQLAAGNSPVLVAPLQPETPPAGDTLSVSFTRDDMLAIATFYPGDPRGGRLTMDAARSLLREQYKITNGIDEAALIKLISERQPRTESTIASGRKAVDGEAAKLEFHFQREHTKRPKLLDGDRVDYRTLDLFTSVKKGQVLITRVPPGIGVDGETVRGKFLKARPGRDMQLPRGKGVEQSEDKLRLIAALDGIVSCTNGQVNVLSRYVIDGDVDMSTGNIDFLGDVEVRGSVITGMTIKAEGAVEVHGVVEAATIIAGGDVLLRQGMQGMARGEVHSGGDVIAKYFERVKIFAQGVVTSDAIYHSEINAVEGVTLAGKHGSLIGGVTRSAHMVQARSIGSPSHTSTIVEVGILPEQRTRLGELELEIKRMNAEREKLALLARTYGAEVRAGEPAERDALRQRVLEANRRLHQDISSAKAERDRISAEMESVTSGRVHVVDTIFDGGRIVIGSSIYNVEKPIEYATFRVVDGEVKFGSCEVT